MEGTYIQRSDWKLVTEHEAMNSIRQRYRVSYGRLSLESVYPKRNFKLAEPGTSIYLPLKAGLDLKLYKAARTESLLPTVDMTINNVNIHNI